jgi:hypothetical protein
LSREKEIIDALNELGLKRNEVGLHSIKLTVQEKLSEQLPPHWEVVARQVLRTLSEVGLVQTDGYENVRLTDAFFETEHARALRQKQSTAPNDGAGGGTSDDGRGRQPPNTNDSGTPGGDGGGDGFREVLSHPYLFSLSHDDFSEILNAI